ncbi:MAG: hypothetical protein ACI4PU_10825, partial [Intestinibacter sp.]
LSEGEALTLDNKLAARSVGKVNYDVNEEENYLTYLGTLVGIPEARYGTEITAASYVIYEDKAGNQYTVYSPYEKGYTSVYELLGNETHWDNQW